MAFGTCHLELREWAQLILLSAMPLLAHELLLLSPVRILQQFHRCTFSTQWSLQREMSFLLLIDALLSYVRLTEIETDHLLIQHRIDSVCIG